MTTYDQIPYPSYCYPQSTPGHLHAISQLFGLKPVSLENAKVLEIGCASGGNLIPLAFRFPNAEFVGIDLSQNQIKEAKSQVEKLELRNVKLISSSIVEHNFKREKFDYIIAHGIYSWVPSNIQNRLLEICGQNLSKNGVAYVSYNTLPGWNAVKTIRDMMLYHGQNFKEPAQKVREARNMIKFVADNVKDQTGSYKDVLQSEIDKLHSVSDNYLLHDHLEAVNEPCYFHEFADKATKQGLIYLAETYLPSMYLGNQNKAVSETLSQIDDPVRLEQYLDFLTNRRFRATLLVKEGNQILRQLNPERLKDIYFIPKYRLKKPIDPNEKDKVDELDLVHLQNENQTANVKGSLISAAIIEMLKAMPNRLNIQQLAEKISESQPELSVDDIQKQLRSNLLKFVFNGIFDVTSDKGNVLLEVSETPLAFSPATIVGLSNEMVPNQHHEAVKLTNDQRLVLQYINGKNSIEQISKYVKQHIEKGELNLNVNGDAINKDSKDLDQYVMQYVQGALNLFAQKSLLVS